MTARVEVLPGPGTVIRFGDLTVWAGPSSSAELLMFLLHSARNVGDAPQGGLRFVDHLQGVLETRDPEHGAPFAVVGPATAGQWVALLHGPVLAWDGTRWLETTPSPGWVRALMEPQPAISLGPIGGPVPHLAPDSPYDLVTGMVPGGGALVVPGAGRLGAAPASRARADEPRPGTDAAPASVPPQQSTAGVVGAGPAPGGAIGDPGAAGSASPAAPQPQPVVVDLRDAAGTPRPPLESGLRAIPDDRPAVDGVRCTGGHFNHPQVATCVWCNAPIPPATAPAPGPRPVLGILLADDGSRYRVGADAVIGSDPDIDVGATGGTLERFVLRCDPGLLAPAHAELRLQGWRLRAVDRGSAAGTFLVTPGTEEWVRLTPYQPVDVPSGSHLSLGQRVLTYLSPWPA